LCVYALAVKHPDPIAAEKRTSNDWFNLALLSDRLLDPGAASHAYRAALTCRTAASWLLRPLALLGLLRLYIKVLFSPVLADFEEW
jgi:hypothetical protein